MTDIVVVTGAAGALGRAVAAHFAASEQSLLLLDRSEELLREALPGLAGRAQFAACDITDVAATSAVVRELAPQGVGALVHLAGGFVMGADTHALPRAQWDQMMNLNAWSFVCATGAVMPSMLASGRGRIVAVSARGGMAGAAQMAAYAASKSALQRLVESLSHEVRERGIAVNSVAPSIIDTPANRASMPKADFARWVSPGRLAEVIGFLASEAASAIHGQHVLVEGLS